MLVSIDGFDVVVDPQRSLCRWRFAPDLLADLRERHNLDIRVHRRGRSFDWTPLQITTLDDFLEALSPDGARPSEVPPVWRRAIANLSVLQRIRVRLGITE